MLRCSSGDRIEIYVIRKFDLLHGLSEYPHDPEDPAVPPEYDGQPS